MSRSPAVVGQTMRFTVRPMIQALQTAKNFCSFLDQPLRPGSSPALSHSDQPGSFLGEALHDSSADRTPVKDAQRLAVVRCAAAHERADLRKGTSWRPPGTRGTDEEDQNDPVEARSFVLDGHRRQRHPLGTTDWREAQQLQRQRIGQLANGAPDPTRRSQQYGAMRVVRAMVVYLLWSRRNTTVRRGREGVESDYALRTA